MDVNHFFRFNTDMNKNKKSKHPENAEIKIALIGARGSGKTTLATGLFATSDRCFTVSADDENIEEYLKQRKTMLQQGKWPEDSNSSREIRLTVKNGGKIAKISFRDYRGEDVVDDVRFISDIVGKPDGAILLFNPGMFVGVDDNYRNTVISRYRRIISHLKNNGCRHVVFAVTASDRLDPETGDLRGKRVEIEGYEKEITDYIENIGGSKWCSRISVSVTGKLEDQSKPALARGSANTASRPFLQILKCISSSATKNKLRRMFSRIFLGAFLLAVAGAGYTYFSYSSESERLAKLVGSVKTQRYDSANTVDEADQKVKTLERLLGELRRFETKFRSNAVLKSGAEDDCASALDKSRFDLLRLKIGDLEERIKDISLKGVSSSDISILSKEIELFSSSDKNLQVELTRLWKHSEQGIRRMHDKRFLINMKHRIFQFDEGCTTNATHSNVSLFVESVKLWEPSFDEGKREREEMLKSLPEKTLKWRTEYEINQIDRLVESGRFETKNVTERLSAGLSVLKRAVSRADGCSADVCNAVAGRMNKARKRLMNSALDDYANGVWNDDKSPDMWPSASDAIDGWSGGGGIFNFMTEDEVKYVNGHLEYVRQDKEKVWRKTQDRRAEEFIKNIKEESEPLLAYNEFCNFCSDNPYNPGLSGDGIVCKAFSDKFDEAVRKYCKDYKKAFTGENRIYRTQASMEQETQRIENAEKTLKEFKDVCETIYRDKTGILSKKIGESRLFKFCRIAGGEFFGENRPDILRMPFPQKIEFVSIENSWQATKPESVPAEYKEKYKENCKEGTMKLNFLSRKFMEGAVTEFDEVKKGAAVEFNAWQELSFYCQVEAENADSVWKGGSDPIKSNGNGHFANHSDFVEKANGQGESEFVYKKTAVCLYEKGDKIPDFICDIELKIKYKISGKSFLDVVYEYYPELKTAE